MLSLSEHNQDTVSIEVNESFSLYAADNTAISRHVKENL